MPEFSEKSLQLLKHCHPDLRRVLDATIAKIDFTVIQCQRGRAAQEEAVKHGRSRAHFGASAHNYDPAMAVDVLPVPFKGWDDKELVGELYRIAETAIDEGKKLGIKITWGGSWTSIKDYDHLELTNWRAHRSKLAE